MKDLITKGEWTYRQNEENGLMQSNFLVESPNKILYVARVQSDSMSLKEAEANAKLIAAAPEMLEALHFIKAELDIYNRLNPNNIICSKQIESAIKKATE